MPDNLNNNAGGSQGANGDSTQTGGTQGGSDNQNSGTSGGSQNPNNQPGTGNQQSNNSATFDPAVLQNITNAIQTLTNDFKTFKTSMNREMAQRRNQIKSLAKGEKPEVEEGDGEGEGEGKLPPEVQRQLDAMQTQLQDLTRAREEMGLQIAVERAASSGGFLHTEDVWKLIDRSSIKPDPNNTGKFLGVEDALKALAEKYPYLKGAREKPNINSQEQGKTEDEAKRLEKLNRRFGIK